MRKTIVYKKTQTGGISSDNEWQRVAQRMTASDNQ